MRGLTRLLEKFLRLKENTPTALMVAHVMFKILFVIAVTAGTLVPNASTKPAGAGTDSDDYIIVM